MFQAFLFIWETNQKSMKITKVTYQRAYVTGPFLQEKIGFEAELGERETEEEALTELKRIADTWHIANNPQVHESPASAQQSAPGPLPSIQVEKTPEEIRIGVMVEDIESCKEVVVLESYRILANQNKTLLEAYNKKHKELSKQ